MLLIILLILLLAFSKLPIVSCLLLVSTFFVLHDFNSNMLSLIVHRLYFSLDSFPLMALPLFVLTGDLMAQGGITQKILDFAMSLFGRIKGGLALVNIFSSLVFSGISGSAVADASAIGSSLIPAMKKDGYSSSFAAAVTATSSVIGPIFPPSGIVIIYAFLMNISIAKLFLACVVPGLLLTATYMIIAWSISRRRNYSSAREQIKPMQETLPKAMVPLAIPLILLFGIFSGIFTPTEVAAITCLLALLYILISNPASKKIIPSTLLASTMLSGQILMLVAAASAFSAVLSLDGFGTLFESMVLQSNLNPTVFLIVFNFLLILIGMVLDVGPAILILSPLLHKIGTVVGVDPLHLGTLVCVNLCLGLATPPIGLALFITSEISKDSIRAIARECLPFLVGSILILLGLILFPQLILYLPSLIKG